MGRMGAWEMLGNVEYVGGGMCMRGHVPEEYMPYCTQTRQLQYYLTEFLAHTNGTLIIVIRAIPERYLMRVPVPTSPVTAPEVAGDVEVVGLVWVQGAVATAHDALPQVRVQGAVKLLDVAPRVKPRGHLGVEPIAHSDLHKMAKKLCSCSAIQPAVCKPFIPPKNHGSVQITPPPQPLPPSP